MTGSGDGMSRAGDGFVHAALIYDSDEDFLAVTVPFLRDGIEAGDVAVLSVNPRQEALVVDAMGKPGGLTVLDDGKRYARPYTTIAANVNMFRDYIAGGASRIRMVGEVPRSGMGSAWHGWVRYEAAINHFCAGLPLSGICPYDSRETPDEVLADVRRTHPYLVTSTGGHTRNTHFVNPAAFLADRARSENDVLEGTPWHLELHDPSPAFARRGVLALAQTTGLNDEVVERLGVAVVEVVTNAVVHGKRPAWLRAWLADDRVVVVVHDQGVGPQNPYVGMVPGTKDRPDALGLHLAYHACNEVTLDYADDGFTVRLVARNPPV